MIDIIVSIFWAIVSSPYQAILHGSAPAHGELYFAHTTLMFIAGVMFSLIYGSTISVIRKWGGDNINRTDASLGELEIPEDSFFVRVYFAIYRHYPRDTCTCALNYLRAVVFVISCSLFLYSGVAILAFISFHLPTATETMLFFRSFLFEPLLALGKVMNPINWEPGTFAIGFGVFLGIFLPVFFRSYFWKFIKLFCRSLKDRLCYQIRVVPKRS